MQSSLSPVLSNWLTRCAENMPARTAIQFGQIHWSFAELARQSDRLARQLTEAGVAEQSRVALLAPNGLAYVALIHALTRLGAILIPLNTRLTQEELRWQLTDGHATALVATDTLLVRASEIVSSLPSLPLLILQTISSTPTQNEVILSTKEGKTYTEAVIALRTEIDLAATQVIMYTSGTTGQPKGVLITYGMQWWSAIGSVLNLGNQANDCWLACLPLFHIGGLSILMRSIIYGIQVVLHEKFDEHAINTSITQDGVTIISVVAVMLQRMLTALAENGPEIRYPAQLRCVLLGGGPAPRPLLEKCASLDIPVAQTYGLTESCSQAVTLTPADALRKLGSAGRPLLPVQVQIMHDDRPVPPGEAGSIYLKGPSITPGYADRPEITRAAFFSGWFSTGDIGYLDNEGYLYVLDRRSDLIISGGENVYPAEIESALLSHPDVAEAGVCGQEDPQWGQIPIAFVRLHPGRKISQVDLQEHVKVHLARYKRPRAIFFVAELPRNSAGKLLRRELAQFVQKKDDLPSQENRA